jgi:hypothetical protein
MFKKLDTNTMILVGIILAMITYGIIAYNKKMWPFSEEYYYGPIINRICQEGDCISEEGKLEAEKRCINEVKSDPKYRFYKSACESNDPEIHAQGCPDDCNADKVTSIYLEKGKYVSQMACKEPLQTKTDRITGDQMCMGKNGMWMLHKKQKQLEEEKKKEAEKAPSSNLEVVEPFSF